MKQLLLLSLLLAAVTARAVSPNFSATTPAGAQRGAEVEVTLRGDRLADTKEILLFHPGIEVVKITHATNDSVKAVFKIAPDCQLGEHPLRIRTEGGISPLRLFFVGPLPNAEEKEPNTEFAQAQKIELNRTINGRIDSEDVDYYSVEVKKGQRLSVEVEGARLGRTMFDSFVAVHDKDGRILARSDDTALLKQDSFVTMIAPEDGAYTIQLRDSSYSGSSHVYRLHVGTFPRPAAVYPLGGKIGETLEVRFIDEASGDFKQSIKLPAEPESQFPVLAERDGLVPSPNWMRASPFPNVLEVEPNDETANATVATGNLPLAFNGIIAKPGDADLFKFMAKKDQEFDFTVHARRLGSSLDPVIDILNSKGNSVARNDDSGGTPDSSQRYRIPADGEYFVKVTDQLKRGGPAFVYRVEATEQSPSVTLFIPDTARYDYETRKSIVVPRGNRFATLFNATRENFGDDLKLTFPKLPAGITVHAEPMVKGQSAVPVVFEATADAVIDGNLLEPVARSTDPAKPVASRFRHLVEWVRIQNNTVYTKSEVGQIAAAVTEEVPFKIRIVEPKVPIVQDGKLDLRIEAERKEGFVEPITVKMLWNPPGLSSLPDMTIAKGSNSVLYRLNAAGNADLKKWKTAVIGQATVKGGTAYVSTQLAPIEVAAPFVTGKMDLTSVERGKTGRIVCKLEQKVPFEGKAIVSLVGLPANVTAKDVEVTKDATEAVFEVVTNDKSRPGLTKGLFCSLTVIRDGEPIIHTIAQGGILRIDEPKVKLSDARPAQNAAAKTAK
jgi:Bacterial pre-peptidase C-terminal domain